MEQINLMLLTYGYLMPRRPQRDEQNPMLRWLYADANPAAQPSLVARLSNRLLYIVGRSLVSVGERMQEPRKDIPAAFPAMK